MQDEVKLCTPEWTSEQTSIPADTIVKLAQKLNATKPACFIDRGYRSERYASEYEGRAASNTGQCFIRYIWR